MSAAGAAMPGWPARIGRILSIALVFLVLGPPVGALVIFVAIGLSQLGLSDPKGLAAVVLFAFIYGVFFSYFAGALPALLVGLAIGAWQVLVRPVSWFLALGVGIAAALVIIVTQRIDLSANWADSSFLQLHAAIVLMCVVPTMLCWCLVRSWYRSISVMPSPSPAEVRP